MHNSYLSCIEKLKKGKAILKVKHIPDDKVRQRK